MPLSTVGWENGGCPASVQLMKHDLGGHMTAQDLRLVLLLPHGDSLSAWARNGSLQREMAVCRRLAEMGGSIAVISYGGTEDLKYQSQLPGIHIAVNRFKLPDKIYARAIPWLHKKCLARANVIKSRQISGSHVALRIAKRFKIPFIARCGYLLSEFESHENPHGFDEALALEDLVFNDSDVNVVTSKAMKAYVMKQHKVEESKIRVIPNYVLEDFFLVKRHPIRTPPRICTVGRLEAQKNLFALIEACAGLDVELEIIGEGSQKDALLAHARAQGVNLHLASRIEHRLLPGHLARAAAFALVSHYEGHPKELIEAMSAATPVLGADRAGIADVIADNRTGLLCGTSAREIRAGLQKLLGDPAFAENLGRNARQFAHEHYHIDAVVALELELYEDLMNGNQTAETANMIGAPDSG